MVLLLTSLNYIDVIERIANTSLSYVGFVIVNTYCFALLCCAAVVCQCHYYAVRATIVLDRSEVELTKARQMEEAAGHAPDSSVPDAREQAQYSA